MQQPRRVAEFDALLAHARRDIDRVTPARLRLSLVLGALAERADHRSHA